MRTFILAAAVLVVSGCSKPADNSAAGNADAMADQLEAKANNLAMMADNSSNSAAVIELENASGALGEASANVRAAANPHEAVKGPPAQ